MRAKTLTTPSDAPCPGIGWLVLPARDRIISQGKGWARGLLICLKRATRGRKGRNSMNVALLVRRQSYWFAQIGAHESRHAVARLSEKACGIRRNGDGCERITGLRINLARGLARATAACPDALKG
jgi:hypothetical protein